MSNKQRIGVLLGLIVSVFFLWRAFAGLHPADVVAYLQQTNLILLIVGGLVYYLAMLVITFRWGFLLRSLANIPLRDLYQLVSIGYMGNNVYPFRSGEALRIVLLNRAYKVPLGRLTTTVLVERVFDGIVMLTFVLVPLLFIENTSPEIRTVATFASPIFFGALAVFLIMAMQPRLMRMLVDLIARFLPGKLAEIVHKLSDEIIAGLEGLRTPRDLAGTVIASYVSWMIEASVYWITAQAFGLSVTYPMMLMVVGVVNLAGLIPASPGQIGVYEYFASLVLISFGIPDARAKAFALLVHIVIWLPPTLLGFIFLARRGLGFSAITHAHELETESLEEAETNSQTQTA